MTALAAGTSAAARREPRTTGGPLALAVGLAVAAGDELLVLRSGTRTAIHIPAVRGLSEIYEAVALAGRYAYFLAVVLLAVTLPVVGRDLWRTGDAAGRVAAAALAVFGVTAVAVRLGSDGVLADAVIVAAVATASVAAAATGGWRRGLAMAMLGLGFVLAASFTLSQRAVAAEIVPEMDARWTLRAAEPLVLAFAATAPWSLAARPGRRAWGLGAAVGVLVLAVFIAEPATARFLLLWNGGLNGAYPGLAYGAAMAGSAAAVGGLAGRGRVLEAAGIVLLFAGGVGLHSTYQTGLVIAGFALFALGAARPR